jgi:hypothetical protein
MWPDQIQIIGSVDPPNWIATGRQKRQQDQDKRGVDTNPFPFQDMRVHQSGVSSFWT